MPSHPSSWLLLPPARSRRPNPRTSQRSTGSCEPTTKSFRVRLENRQTYSDRTLHHPNAWIAIANVDSVGKPTIRIMTLDEYHGNNAPRRQGFWEWETDRVTKRSGNMVHLWSSYASARTRGGDPFTRGVNSVTLFYDGERWWIMNWMFDATGG